MTNDLLDTLRAHDPARPRTDAVRAATTDMVTRIAETPRPAARSARTRSRDDRAPWAFGAVAAALVALLVVVVVRVAPAPNAVGDGGTQVFGDVGPHLLLTAEGWTLDRVDVQSDSFGEATFSGPEGSMDLHWRPAEEHSGWLADRRTSTTPLDPIVVDGRQADLMAYAATDHTALWTDDVRSLELRGGGMDAEAFTALAASLAPATPEEWSAALPDSAISPSQRGTVVSQMLDGLPLPPGFDQAALEGAESTNDRYQLGAAVTGAVACGWIEEWIAARGVGDDTRATTARDALASAHGWPILDEMAAEGAYPQVLRQYADAVNADGTIEGGTTLTVEESYAAALGC
ncbi:hypothetical protein [Euzebya pacifica]|mgnify:FL=1|uniref:hypothetical protein n=1 Tax=Euzebya pacifica TaxID=1608957 RepID=UPI0030F7F27E